jgi:cysteine desulfurase
MGRALELAVAERDETTARIGELRTALMSAVGVDAAVQMTGHPTERLPGIASFVVPGLDGTALTIALDLAGVAASTGSACVSGSNEISHVLTAMGYADDEARGALRFSLGRTTIAEEVTQAADLIVKTIAHQREAATKLAGAMPVLKADAAAAERTGVSAG